MNDQFLQTDRDSLERDRSRHTLTIKQAAHLFANLGVPRAPRSVQRFCELGSIDCIMIKGDKTERYFVSQESVERYAQELAHMQHISAITADDDVTRHNAPQRDATRIDAPRRDELVTVEPAPTPRSGPDPEIAHLKSRLDELEKEKMQLAIDRAAKEQVINQMLDQQRKWFERVDNQGRQIGRLEMQVQQLAAPQHAESRHDAPELQDVVTARIVSEEGRAGFVSKPEPVAPTPAPELPKRSFFGRMFG